ncbi:radical SAM protein [Caldalkalibacillus thermarum]|nr:radical SAM protein [Caldalkalibacillus thermarum]
MTPSATPLVTKEAIRKAKEVGLSRWAFSLDGSTAEVHDAFRGTSGSYDLTMRAIDYLRELDLPLQINTTVSRYNVHDLQNIAELLKKLDVVLWSVFFLVPTGRGRKEDMISPVEHEKVLNWLYELSLEAPFDIKTTAAQHYRRVVIQSKRRAAKEKINADSQPAYEEALNKGKINPRDGLGRAPQGVNDGNGFVFISHIGDVYPSGLLPVRCGNVREQPLAEIYRESPVMKALRNPDQYKGKCGVCEFNKICGGSRSRAYAVTGDYLESEPYCVYIPPKWRALQKARKSGDK